EALADLVLRANRCGHRVLVAQRAFAARKPGAPPAPEPARLAGRHPSLPRALARQAAAAAAEALLAPLAAERPSVLFACDHLLPMHYGTAELVRPSIAAFAARHGARHEVLVSGEPAALAFHGLDRLPGVEAITPAEAARRAPFAAAFRLCQPHRLGDLAALGRLAALPGIVMLDTIALDCQHLDEADLGPLYAAMPDAVVMLGAISAAALAQAERRIPLPASLTRFVMPLSAAPAEYARGEGPRPPGLPPPGYLLLVGNGYAHKHLAPTLAALRAAALERPVVVLGAAVEEGAAWSAASGALSDAVVGALYAGAAAVLYPSHHEGFGLPLMHALAHRRPILARDLPSAREVRARAGAAGANIHLRTDTAALVRLACDPPGWVEAAPGAAAGEGWAAAGDALAAALAAAREQLDLASLERRLARLAWLEGWLAAGRIPALERELAAARASRAAELSARLAAAEARASAAEAKASAVQAQLARLAAHPVWSVTRALRRVPAAAATGRLLLGLLRRTRARGDGPA
ncbi:MAG: hypothetical protein MUC64_16425, partial [Rubritepida sp.]|nr:hypothetical protein [Rubritepida sp.]